MTMNERESAEKAALSRFNGAVRAGAAERTALNLAAWAWVEYRPQDRLSDAVQEVARLVRRTQKPDGGADKDHIQRKSVAA